MSEVFNASGMPQRNRNKELGIEVSNPEGPTKRTHCKIRESKSWRHRLIPGRRRKRFLSRLIKIRKSLEGDKHPLCGMIATPVIAPSPNQGRRWLQHTVLCAVLSACLASCSTLTFTYTYGEPLLLWRIDRYFDLSREQERLVKAWLADFHSWHRQMELPRYAEFLRQVQDRWRDGVSAEEVEWTFDTFAKLRSELTGRIAPAGAVLLPLVDTTQIRHLDRVLQRDNRDWQSQAAIPAEERSVKRAKTVLSWLRDWLGPLTPEQERLVTRLLKDMPDTTEDWLAYRTQRQQQFVQLLQSRPNPALIEHRLQEWLATPEKTSYVLSRQNLRQDVKMAVLAIDRTVTPRQRAHASEKLQILIRQIEGLAAS